MAKTLELKDPASGMTYTLEFTRKTVAQMERNGFIAEDVVKKPASMLPVLFAGAFLANHRHTKPEVIDALYDRAENKSDLIAALVEMYNEPIVSLLEEPDKADTEGNVTWKMGW